MGENFYEKYQSKLGLLFGLYGKFAARHPWKIMLISIFLNAIFGIGIMRLEMETNAIELYTPRNSQALRDQDLMQSIYIDRSGDNFASRALLDFGLFGEIIIRTRDGSNILANETMEELLRIDSVIQSITVLDASGTPVSYASVCALDSQGCVIHGGVIFSQEFQAGNMVGNISWPILMNKLLKGVFENVQVSNGLLVSATVVKLRYYLLQNTESNKTISKNWERNFLTKMDSMETNLLDVAYTYSDAVNSELQGSTPEDIIFISVTFIVMILYVTFATVATGNGINCIADRQNLGKAGILPPCFAIVSSIGILCLAGVKFVSTIGVMPFLLLAIGIDEIFVLLSGLADTIGDTKYKTLEDRITRMMQTSGLAITVTSLTDGLAFAVGTTSDFNGVRYFSAYTGLAVSICYINQLTIFVPCVVLHEKRVAARRHQFTCSVTKTKDEAQNEGRSKGYVLCCIGDIPKRRKDVENYFDTYPKKVLNALLKHWIYKFIILLLFGGYTAASIYGVVNLKQGLIFSDLAIKGSFFHKYSLWDEMYFTIDFPVSFIVTSTENYNSVQTQSAISNLIQRAQDDVNIDDDFSVDWLTTFTQHYSSIDSQAAFIQNLTAFLDLESEFKNDVVIDYATNTIRSSRFYVLTKELKTTKERGEFMMRMRNIADKSSLDCVAFAPLFIYFEQYVVVLSNTLKTVGIAVGVMFVVTVLFMPSLTMIILVTVSLVLILLGVFGFMYYWDLTISALTMVLLIMSVGFAVDFSVHICHAYMSSQDRGRGKRVRGAIDLAGGPIFNAALSSVIGILMLLASSTYTFRTFFKLILLVSLLGLAHGGILLPVILSIIGPQEAERNKSDNFKPRVTHVKEKDKPTLVSVSENGKDIPLSHGVINERDNRPTPDDIGKRGSRSPVEIIHGKGISEDRKTLVNVRENDRDKLPLPTGVAKKRDRRLVSNDIENAGCIPSSGIIYVQGIGEDKPTSVRVCENGRINPDVTKESDKRPMPDNKENAGCIPPVETTKSTMKGIISM